MPAALTAYRHFFLYKKAENSGLPALVPMAPHTEAAYGTYHVPWSEWGSGKPATFHAECHWSEDEPRHEGSPAPQLDCSCGFYAHYFDGTDFYPYTKWYPRQESGWTAGKIMVRTVVELSGRIVMGHLGVRAEKLTIKALAIDWDKARESDRVSRYETSSFGEIYPVWEYPVFDMAPDVVAGVEALAEDMASVYGYRFYRSVDEMYRHHPQQDLAALGISAMTEQELREKRDREYFERIERDRKERERERYRNGWRQQQGQFYYSATRVSGMKGISSAYLTVDEVTDAVKKALGDARGLAKGGTIDPPPSPFERAIEAKKQRPAPPGTGIDRRRRKL